MECIHHIEPDTNPRATNYFLKLDEMNIDSEIQLLQGFEKLTL
jgi:hypothetical protein